VQIQVPGKRDLVLNVKEHKSKVGFKQKTKQIKCEQKYKQLLGEKI